MDQEKSEKGLTISYALLTFLGAITSITSGIAWGHWKETLDKCVRGRNCSCILYGTHTYSQYFQGGYQAPCIWVTYGPLIYILLCIAMGSFHGFRVLFSTKRTVTRTVTAKNEVGEITEVHTVQGEGLNLLPRVFWVTMSVVTVIFTVYALVHFSIFMDGYLSTCKQYRLTLAQIFQSHGTVLPMIYGRLSCNSVFDFMDYIQPDTGNAYREGFINTGLDLTIGIVASFFSWVVFALASFFNIKLARIKP